MLEGVTMKLAEGQRSEVVEYYTASGSWHHPLRGAANAAMRRLRPEMWTFTLTDPEAQMQGQAITLGSLNPNEAAELLHDALMSPASSAYLPPETLLTLLMEMVGYAEGDEI